MSDIYNREKWKNTDFFSPGIKPGTFCVLDKYDKHYTTKTCYHLRRILKSIFVLLFYIDFGLFRCSISYIDNNKKDFQIELN